MSEWSEQHLRKMAAAEDEAGCINIGSADEVMQRLAKDSRTCTCHPSEAPVPCQQRYALTECKLAAAEATVAQQAATISELTEERDALKKNRDTYAPKVIAKINEQRREIERQAATISTQEKQISGLAHTITTMQVEIDSLRAPSQEHLPEGRYRSIVGRD